MTLKLAAIKTDNGSLFTARIDESSATLLAKGSLTEFLHRPNWRDLCTTNGEQISLEDFQYAPLVTSPSRVFCVGLNYSGHISETGKPTPTKPTIFTKFADSLVGAYDDIELPYSAESTNVDFEAELVVVVGAPIRRADTTSAIAAIAGYSCGNDISVRDWQNATSQFTAGKAWDKSTPIGPVMKVARPHRVAKFDISCDLNGERMQQANTDEMVFDPVSLIRYISTFTTMRPGDVVFTGTPAGVGLAREPQRFLKPGDVLETNLHGIGSCRNTFVKPSRSSWTVEWPPDWKLHEQPAK